MTISINNIPITQSITKYVDKIQTEILTFTFTAPIGSTSSIVWKLIKTPTSYNDQSNVVVFGNSNIQSTNTTETLLLDLAGSYKIEIEEKINGLSKKYLVFIECSSLKDKISSPFPGETTELNSAEGWARKVERSIQGVSQHEGNISAIGILDGEGELSIGECVVISDVSNTIISGFSYKFQKINDFKLINPEKNSAVGIVIKKASSSAEHVFINSPIYVVAFKGSFDLDQAITGFSDNDFIYYDTTSTTITNEIDDHYVGKYFTSAGTNFNLIIEQQIQIIYETDLPLTGYFYYTKEHNNTSDWIRVGTTEEYYIRITHGLNTQNLIVECWNLENDNKEYKVFPSRIKKVDDNVIDIFVEGTIDENARYTGRTNILRVDVYDESQVKSLINIDKDGVFIGYSDYLNFKSGEGINLNMIKQQSGVMDIEITKTGSADTGFHNLSKNDQGGSLDYSYSDEMININRLLTIDNNNLYVLKNTNSIYGLTDSIILKYDISAISDINSTSESYGIPIINVLLDNQLNTNNNNIKYNISKLGNNDGFVVYGNNIYVLNTYDDNNILNIDNSIYSVINVYDLDFSFIKSFPFYINDNFIPKDFNIYDDEIYIYGFENNFDNKLKKYSLNFNTLILDIIITGTFEMYDNFITSVNQIYNYQSIDGDFIVNIITNSNTPTLDTIKTFSITTPEINDNDNIKLSYYDNKFYTVSSDNIILIYDSTLTLTNSITLTNNNTNIKINYILPQTSDIFYCKSVIGNSVYGTIITKNTDTTATITYFFPLTYVADYHMTILEKKKIITLNDSNLVHKTGTETITGAKNLQYAGTSNNYTLTKSSGAFVIGDLPNFSSNSIINKWFLDNTYPKKNIKGSGNILINGTTNNYQSVFSTDLLLSINQTAILGDTSNSGITVNGVATIPKVLLGNTPVTIAQSKASNLNNGYISSADWNNFNSYMWKSIGNNITILKNDQIGNTFNGTYPHVYTKPELTGSVFLYNKVTNGMTIKMIDSGNNIYYGIVINKYVTGIIPVYVTSFILDSYLDSITGELFVGDCGRYCQEKYVITGSWAFQEVDDIFESYLRTKCYFNRSNVKLIAISTQQLGTGVNSICGIVKTLSDGITKENVQLINPFCTTDNSFIFITSDYAFFDPNERLNISVTNIDSNCSDLTFTLHYIVI
jgi:hypothetical protein